MKARKLLSDDKLQELCNEDYELVIRKIDEAKRRFVVAIQDDLIDYVEAYENSKKSSKSNDMWSSNLTKFDNDIYNVSDTFNTNNQLNTKDDSPYSLTGDTLSDATKQKSIVDPNQLSIEEEEDESSIPVNSGMKVSDGPSSIEHLAIEGSDLNSTKNPESNLTSVDTTTSLKTPASSPSPSKPSSQNPPQSQDKSPPVQAQAAPGPLKQRVLVMNDESEKADSDYSFDFAGL